MGNGIFFSNFDNIVIIILYVLIAVAVRRDVYISVKEILMKINIFL